MAVSLAMLFLRASAIRTGGVQALGVVVEAESIACQGKCRRRGSCMFHVFTKLNILYRNEYIAVSLDVLLE